jgi:hypothetical protein
LSRIRARVVAESPVITIKEEETTPVYAKDPPSVTVSLKSVLTEVVHADAANQLCRRVRPLLEQLGITTFKKHQAIHILKADAQRVKDLGAGLM